MTYTTQWYEYFINDCIKILKQESRRIAKVCNEQILSLYSNLHMSKSLAKVTLANLGSIKIKTVLANEKHAPVKQGLNLSSSNLRFLKTKN